MFYRFPFEVETGHQPLQNFASLTDKSNRVQRWFDFLNAYNSTLKQRLKNAKVNVDVLPRPPLPATAEGLQPRYRLAVTDKSNRVQRWFDFLNAYNSTLKQRLKNAKVNVDVLPRPPLPATAEGLQPRYRLADHSSLAV